MKEWLEVSLKEKVDRFGLDVSFDLGKEILPRAGGRLPPAPSANRITSVGFGALRANACWKGGPFEGGRFCLCFSCLRFGFVVAIFADNDTVITRGFCGCGSRARRNCPHPGEEFLECLFQDYIADG